MDLFERIAAAQQPPQYPAVAPDVMAAHLRSLTDQQWGRYAFSREPLEGRFTAEQKDAYTAAAVACGEQWADTIAAHGQSRDPATLAATMGVRVQRQDIPAGGGQVLFAQYVEPDEITVFTDCLDRAAELGAALPPRAQLETILLAHELFHVVEAQNADTIYTRCETIELWRRPFHNRSHIICLSEIAAMAFARRLLGLDYNPYALDVLLVYPYDANNACGLYDEICELAAACTAAPVE